MKNIQFFLVVTLVFSGCGLAQHGAIIGAYEAIEKGNCISAYSHLSDAEKFAKTTPEIKAEITYLRAVCLEKEQKYAEALGQYMYLIEHHPNSEYTYRVKSKLSILKKYREKKLKEIDKNTKI